MVTLGIETSCDETACAVVRESRVLSNIVSSSVSLHEKYGGVIPEIASRFHIEYINRVAKRALKKAGKSFRDLDLIAVTDGPGLPGCLLVGLSFARALSHASGKKLVRVNHLKAHIYANFLNKDASLISFPFVGIVVSGGHTNIFIAKSFEEFRIIGMTKDDAVGEAFDKVAKILGIGYPGGPKIEKYARRFAWSLKRPGGRKKAPIDFPRSYMEKDSFDFSLSGIKTAVFYYVKKNKIGPREIPRIAWSFQEAVFDVLVERIMKACRKFGIKNVLLGGGVISNKRLTGRLKVLSGREGYKLFYPPQALCVDNAAMVAGLGERIYKKRR